MRKHLLLLFLIFFGGVFFAALNKKDLNACCKNETSCSAIEKREIRQMAPVIVEEADNALDMLVNPLIN
jgi:hypothetical protein